jgi:pimeloyl-ACP methyl ester carboxylesterase
VTYVTVDGLRTWHEVHGQGQPVVLLHGAFAGASSWAAQAPVLAQGGYRVHVPERRGHAHTPDVPGPLTYGVMADDTVAYLDEVVGGPAHLVGWSDGAVVALLVAQRRPDLVGRLVLIGQYYNASGKVPGGLVDQLEAGGDQVMGFLRGEYDRVSPDGPEHSPVVFAQDPADAGHRAGARPRLPGRDRGTHAGAAGRPRRGDPRAQCRRGRGPAPGAAGRPPGHPRPRSFGRR